MKQQCIYMRLQGLPGLEERNGTRRWAKKVDNHLPLVVEVLEPLESLLNDVRNPLFLHPVPLALKKP